MPELLDCAVQRFKALEKAVVDASWREAQYQELLPPVAVTITGTDERQGASRVYEREAKLAEKTAKAEV